MGNRVEKKVAIKKIKEWADNLELDVDEDGFNDSIKKIVMAVVNNRIDFNSTDRTFSLQLMSPIDGIEIVTIREFKLEGLKSIQGIPEKEEFRASIASLSKVLDLPEEQLSQLGQKDISRINEIVAVFFG